MSNTTDTKNNNYSTARRVSTETKSSYKTTELIAYVAAVLAVIVTALVVGDDGENTVDPFSAEQAMRYVTFLTIGYMIARGLAKSGTRGYARDND